jgi:hypothetical protein
MASINPLSADDIKRLRSDGLLDVKDSRIGEEVQRMKDARFPVRRAEGLNFCKQNVLDDTVSRKYSVQTPSDLILGSKLDESSRLVSIGVVSVSTKSLAATRLISTSS